MTLVHKVANRFRRHIYYPALSLLEDSLWSVPGVGVTQIGSRYGGGWVAIDKLNEGSIVYSFGIGCDITFDEALIERTGCRVYGFDPTPRVKDWVQERILPSGFGFEPIGIAEQSGRRPLFLPVNPDYVSGSITHDLSGGSVECEFLTLEDIMQAHAHEWVDLVKLDDEGAEYPILRSWTERESKPCVGQMWVEFHPERSGTTTKETAHFVRKLASIGLVPAKRAYLQNPNHYLLMNVAQ
jgi:FkbM family methyltransferase